MYYQKLSEHDLENLFAKKKNNNKTLQFILYLILTLIIIFVAFLLINYNSVTKLVSYWYNNEFKSSTDQNQVLNQTESNPDLISQLDFDIKPNHIYIPKIDVDAPITWNVPNTPDRTNQALKDGVIHLNGTSHPDQDGNVFMTGHSSDYIWSNGKYKNVFSLLGKLVVGDYIYIKYQNIIYVYQIYDKITVDSDQIGVLSQGDKPILSLMTCTPVGTSLKRLIIKADLVFSD